MQIRDRQPADVPDPAELRRAAHKIAWTRMNGTIDAANPFVAADSGRLAPGHLRDEDSSSRHR
jgi:hypothetical protein